MQDLAALFETHRCDNGRCTRRTHTQLVLVSPADVATVADQLRTFATVRDCLAEHSFRMLETVPPPEFDDADAEPQPWPIRYDAAPPPASAYADAPAVSLLPSFWPFRRQRRG